MPQPRREPKLRRRDLRQPDEFETLIGQGSAWVQDNLRLVVGAGVAIAVVVAIAFLIQRAQGARNERAAGAFRDAQVLFQAGKFDDAAQSFATVAQEHGGTPSGQLAALYRGHALARKGDATAAASAYAEYLTATGDAPYLRQEALTGLARAREATGDANGALDAFKQAGELDGPFRTDALLGQARLEEAGGHADVAKEIYGRLIKDASDPDLRAFLLTKVPAPATDATAAAQTE